MLRYLWISSSLLNICTLFESFLSNILIFELNINSLKLLSNRFLQFWWKFGRKQEGPELLSFISRKFFLFFRIFCVRVTASVAVFNYEPIYWWGIKGKYNFQGCGSELIVCVSGSSKFGQCGSGSLTIKIKSPNFSKVFILFL